MLLAIPGNGGSDLSLRVTENIESCGGLEGFSMINYLSFVCYKKSCRERRGAEGSIGEAWGLGCCKLAKEDGLLRIAL